MRKITQRKFAADLRGDAALWSRAVAPQAASMPASAAAAPLPRFLPPVEQHALGPAQPAALPGAPAAAEVLSANMSAIIDESPPTVADSLTAVLSPVTVLM